MAAVYDLSTGRVSIGRILSRAFGAITGNPGVTLSIALLFGALPQAGFTYLQRVLVRSDRIGPLNTATIVAAVLSAAFVGIVLALVVQGGLVRATMAEMEGDHASFGQCVASGFSRILPMLGIGILVSIGLCVGLLLLVVPGIIFYLMYTVAVPVTVVERRGVIASMSRSGDLTKGARGIIFALMLIVWAVTIGTGLLSGVGSTAIVGMDGMTPAAREWLAFAVDVVATTLVTVFSSAIPTALYVELREWKEGPITDTLSEIFA
ncbi:hypothetical protein FPZ24_14705 [Sphingomonas panacisoli]|uniref:Glycerophosphoryl diester phosphodiesterase membrane domain-containing protein n=1 Tax=Sphingomonas panacisoli TaxID=1813879 RepID=A0A5B8LLJ1_9SPHN|nr:hypothetical protein [Sphingomonas panacisoli]QDZ08565.1 hypothetical protein FPZ24_14705 [Sphingomonas panacisoli]